MTQAEYLDALARLDLGGTRLAHELQGLGDERSFLAISRETQRLKHPWPSTRKRHVPWAVAALVRVLERERELTRMFVAEIEALRQAGHGPRRFAWEPSDIPRAKDELVERFNDGETAS